MQRATMIVGVLTVLVGSCGFRIELAGTDAASGDASGPVLDAPGSGADPDAAAPPVDAPASDCITTTVKASKTYVVVPFNFDGFLFQDNTYPKLVIPATLPVTNGNAANGCAFTLMARVSDGTLIRCRYRGGAEVTHVGADPVQVQKGLTYVFDACTRGQACPSLTGPVEAGLVAGSQFATRAGASLRVDGGDDQAGATEVTVPFQRCR